MGLGAFRLHDRRLAERAKAPIPPPPRTAEDRLATAREENHRLRAEIKKLRERIQQLEAQAVVPEDAARVFHERPKPRKQQRRRG
jgi:predicted  nucleic acid-binding Zn-ribbon protein